jgi:hypothetical protein
MEQIVEEPDEKKQIEDAVKREIGEGLLFVIAFGFLARVLNVGFILFPVTPARIKDVLVSFFGMGTVLESVPKFSSFLQVGSYLIIISLQIWFILFVRSKSLFVNLTIITIFNCITGILAIGVVIFTMEHTGKLLDLSWLSYILCFTGAGAVIINRLRIKKRNSEMKTNESVLDM